MSYSMKAFLMGGLLGLVTGCAGPVASRQEGSAGPAAPYYRVFRGVKRGDVSSGDFLQALGMRFIPAAPQAHAGNGLVAYLPAVTRVDGSSPDEFAIVVYRSEEAYVKARATPEGKAYSDLHWDLFDRERTRSGKAVPWAGEGNPDQPYDVLNRPVDWQKGYSTFFFGRRKPEVSPEAFVRWLPTHVNRVASAFDSGGDSGLRGYVLVFTPDWEIAYQNWDSEQAMKDAFQREAGRAIVEDASPRMASEQFSAAVPFAGRADAGTAYNVLFKHQ